MATKLTFKERTLEHLLNKYIDWLATLKGKIILGSLLLLLTVLPGAFLNSLSFDFEFENFFPRNHPETRKYKDHVEQFGYDNDHLQIILENPGGVFDSTFLNNALAFETVLKTLTDVEHVYSPLSLQHVIKSPTGLIIFPLLHMDDPMQLSSDSIRIFGNPFYRSAFSEDARAVSLYMGHAHFDDTQRTATLLSSIKRLASENNLPVPKLIGKLSASQVFIRYIEEDFGKFLIGSFVLSFGLLLVLFRSFKSALLPFIISLVSLIWLFGWMSMLGIKVNLLVSLLPPIMFFVSMSDAVHLLNAFQKAKGDKIQDRLKKALNVVWIPTLLTSVTTAIGFLSLIWINTQPVQTLGVFSAFGILIAFVVTFSVGPLFLLATQVSQSQKPLNLPNWLLINIQEKPHKILIISVLIFIICIPGISFLKINAFLLEDLPPDSVVRLDFEYADANFGGSKPYEVRVDLADTTKSIWDKEVMDEIVKIEDYLINQYPVAKVQSPATIIKYLSMVNNGGLNEYYSYPNTERSYLETIRLKRRIDPKRMDKLVTEDGKTTRLIGFITELGSYETGLRNQQLNAFLADSINNQIIKAEITGTTYLIDKSHELLSWNLIKGLITAILVIGIILGAYFKSWKLLLVSLIPNLIPLLLVAGIIGWLGVSLKMTTVIIFVIVFGIAVDDTIHMMSHYLKLRKLPPNERLASTFKHAGSAMLITTIIMTAGFSLFLLSNFGATYYLGLFISLSLAIALLVDLTLLPILLIRYLDK
ncbi:MAG: MMPL family transporter [Ekhidna sp.]